MRIIKKALKEFKTYDILLVILCVGLSFVPLKIFTSNGANGAGTDKLAVIRINGKEVARYDLNAIDHLEKTYHPAKGKYNIIEIKKGKIRDKEDNSPDQIAVKTGWISEIGQTAICLPHHLVIEVIGSDQKKMMAILFIKWLAI